MRPNNRDLYAGSKGNCRDKDEGYGYAHDVGFTDGLGLVGRAATTAKTLDDIWMRQE